MRGSVDAACRAFVQDFSKYFPHTLSLCALCSEPVRSVSALGAHAEKILNYRPFSENTGKGKSVHRHATINHACGRSGCVTVKLG